MTLALMNIIWLNRFNDKPNIIHNSAGGSGIKNVTFNVKRNYYKFSLKGDAYES